MKNKERFVNDNSENARSAERITAFDRFIPDGADVTKYQEFSSAPLRIVPTNCNLLLVGTFNKSKDYMMVKGNGLHFINPILYKSIFVPTNDTSIDYSPSVGDVGGFKFQTDVANSGMNVELDPVVKVKIIDPIKYLYESNNVMAELKDLIMTVIRGFVANRTADEILTTTKYSLKDFDATGEFEKFKEQYGLKVIDLSFKNAKYPDDIMKAREQSIVARENIKKAKYEQEVAAHKAAASAELTKVAIEQAEKAGLSGQALLDFVNMYVNMEISKNPNTHIFMNGTNNNGNSSIENMLMMEMYSKMCSMNGNSFNPDGYVVYDDDQSQEQSAGMVKRRRLQ